MLQNKISILSTRPFEKDELKHLPSNFIVDEMAFIETKNIIDEIKEKEIISLAHQKRNIVFTSMNAAEAIVAVLKKNNLHPDWEIFCLGNATKNILQHWFEEKNIYSNGNNAFELAQFIIQRQMNDVVFFCGNVRRNELPEMLAAMGITVNEIVVYETIEIENSIHKNYDGILFFSPSAVRSFFSSNKISPDSILFAIGVTTESEIKKYTGNTVEVANATSKEKLLNQSIQYFQTKIFNQANA